MAAARYFSVPLANATRSIPTLPSLAKDSWALYIVESVARTPTEGYEPPPLAALSRDRSAVSDTSRAEMPSDAAVLGPAAAVSRPEPPVTVALDAVPAMAQEPPRSAAPQPPFAVRSNVSVARAEPAAGGAVTVTELVTV